jgi:hypothetical protein
MNNSTQTYDAFFINALRVPIDNYCKIAVEQTKLDFKNEIQVARTNLDRTGRTGQIAKLSQKINETRLDNITRLLLSDKEIYTLAIYRATGISSDNVTELQKRIDDIEGLYSEILRLIKTENGFKEYFVARLITEVIDSLNYTVDLKDHQWQLLDDFSLAKDISIRDGEVQPAVKEILDQVNRYGKPMYYLNQFIDSPRNLIDKSNFSAAIKQSIINELIKQGIKIDDGNIFNAGIYDKYFVQAYDRVTKQSTVADDPISTIGVKGSKVAWDFTIDTFDSIESQGVIPINIKAAGALEYVYYIGEVMRVFNVANALVLRWASGRIDIPEGKINTAIYNFHKLRNQRNTPEERAMLYKRVLNRGDGQILSMMVVNDAFPALWHQLMTEITEYIRKVEASSSISRASIFQATKNLQYNLSEHMKGMARIQVTEDYAHLKAALDLLNSPEILDNFGGRRKSCWSVIEQIAKEDLRTVISTSNIRTLAVEGNKIFQWLANFDEGKTQDNEFQQLLQSAEAWIIAQASLESNNNGSQSPQHSAQPKMPDFLNNMNNMNFPNFDQKGDDFADW